MTPLADLVLVVLVLEATGLYLLRRRLGTARVNSLWPTLASGACLVLALRGALTGSTELLLAALCAALAAHLADLWWRLAQRSSG